MRRLVNLEKLEKDMKEEQPMMMIEFLDGEIIEVPFREGAWFTAKLNVLFGDKDVSDEAKWLRRGIKRMAAEKGLKSPNLSALSMAIEQSLRLNKLPDSIQYGMHSSKSLMCGNEDSKV